MNRQNRTEGNVKIQVSTVEAITCVTNRSDVLCVACDRDKNCSS